MTMNAAEKTEAGFNNPPTVEAVAVTGLTPVPVNASNGQPPVGSRQAIPMHQQEKQGAKCCGCCCDYRRAVIIIAIIFICVTAISLIFAVLAVSLPGVSNFDDDEIEEIFNGNTTRNIATSAVSFVMALVALLGARFYNIPMLCLVILWFLVSYALSVYFGIDNINQVNALETGDVEYRYPIGVFVGQAIVTALWIYPHVGLILEIRSGIMSRETYPREEYSCCCVDNRRHQ